jgi:hypothetical protein
MGIVETDQSRAIRRVQRERVGQSVRSLLGRLDALDFELDPVALFEMVDATIESQQEFESVFGCSVVHIMSEHDNKILHTAQSRDRRSMWGAATGPVYTYTLRDRTDEMVLSGGRPRRERCATGVTGDTRVENRVP